MAILAIFTPLCVVHPAALPLSVIGVTSIFVALGVSVASRLWRLESLRLVSAPVTVPLYRFSGGFYPISTLPAPTRWIVHVDPSPPASTCCASGCSASTRFRSR